MDMQDADTPLTVNLEIPRPINLIWVTTYIRTGSIALLMLLLVLAACGDDAEDTTTTTTVPSSTAATSTAGPTTTVTTTTNPSSTTSTSAPTTTATTTTASPTSTSVAAPGTVAIDVTVTDGEVAGPGRVTVPRGATIQLTVTSDEIDEVHFHGYDVYADVAPGSPAMMIVVADIPGVFEVELEGAGIELVLVEVQ